MPPALLFGSYKQYKADTNETASWLVRTAQRFGYDLSSLSDVEAPQSTAPKLKGRARKLARDAAKTSSKSKTDRENTEDPTRHIIAVKHFVELAQYIASNRGGELPNIGTFMSTLSRAIKLRKCHSRWFYGQRDESLVPANISHDHFTKILQQVKGILHPFCLSVTSDTQETTTKIEDICNRFSELSMEVPSEQNTAAESEPMPTTPATDREAVTAEYVAETPQTSFERYLSAHLLLHDAARIRRFIQHIWGAYVVGAADLMVCAMTTNTAIDLIHRMHEQFQDEHGGSVDYTELVTTFYGAQCKLHGIDAEARLESGDPFNFEAEDIADFVMLGTYVLLDSFAGALVGGSIPATRPGFSGSPNLSAPRWEKTPRARFEEDKALLPPILPDVLFLSLDKNLPAEDMFLRAGRSLFQTKTVTFWQVFASQVFLDIHHVMRSKTDQAFSDLKIHARRIRESTLKVLDSHKGVFRSAGTRNVEKILHDLIQDLDTLVFNDLVAQMMRQKHVPSLPPPFQLMKHNPVFCGMIAFHFYLSVKRAGIVFANSAGSILSMAHLYNALQQETLLSNRWPDLDLVLSSQSQTQIFVGEKPNSTDDYLSRFCLAIGMSAQVFASDSRKRKKASTSKSGPRKLLDTSSPVSEAFSERLARSDESIELSIQKIEAIIHETDSYEILKPYKQVIHNRMRHDPTLSDDMSSWESDERQLASELAGAPVATDFNRAFASRYRSAWVRQEKKLSPIQLLRLLFTSITRELPCLQFSYLTFHARCWSLLQRIHSEHEPSFRKYIGATTANNHGKSYLEHQEQLPYIVGYTFAIAKTSQSIAREIQPEDLTTKSRLLTGVAKTVDEFLSDGLGSVGVVQLLAHETRVVDNNGKRIGIDVLDDGEDDIEEDSARWQ